MGCCPGDLEVAKAIYMLPWRFGHYIQKYLAHAKMAFLKKNNKSLSAIISHVFGSSLLKRSISEDDLLMCPGASCSIQNRNEARKLHLVDQEEGEAFYGASPRTPHLQDLHENPNSHPQVTAVTVLQKCSAC